MKRPTHYRVVVLTSCHEVASIKLHHYLPLCGPKSLRVAEYDS